MRNKTCDMMNGFDDCVDLLNKVFPSDKVSLQLASAVTSNLPNSRFSRIGFYGAQTELGIHSAHACEEKSQYYSSN